MPHPRRTLTVDQAYELVANDFDGTGEDLVGLEVEWPVHHIERRTQGAPTRPTTAELSPILDVPLPSRGRITIEPGGQVELSTAPQPNATAAIAALEADAQVLHSALHQRGLRPLDLALDDRRPPERILDRPRYAAMEAFFAHRGDAGSQMMTNTASVQLNISHDPGGGDQRWELANRIGPVLIAAFANSPGIGRDGRHWQSRRQETWSRIDPGRTAPLAMTSSPEREWARYALAADVFFVDTGRSGVALPPGLTFGAWINHGHSVGWPTSEDLRYHLTTLFPPIRPRGWLELRMLDALPPDARAVAAHTVCVATSTAAAADLLARLPDTRGLWLTAARAGLAHPTLRDAAIILFDTVKEVLAHSPGRLHDAEMIGAFADRYTRRGLTPGSDQPTLAVIH